MMIRTLPCLLSICAVPAIAADKPVTGPVPAWVKPAPIPADTMKPDTLPIRVLLLDQQSRLERDKVSTHSVYALKVQTPQGLAAGNVSLPWRPETDTLTVHRIAIRRGAETIDVLKSQSFTVARRETNMEIAMFDGVLTANIQPEGLQVGDVLEVATTVESRDPVLRGHIEQAGAAWNIPVTRARLRLEWPANVPLRIRQTGALPGAKTGKASGYSSSEWSIDNVTPVIAPKGAPSRYAIARLVEATDFANWGELAALEAPLYETAAALPTSGPLADEFARIKAASADPVKRAEAALALVQDRVRYVALLMGAGAMTPAKAEETWSRRYGDCKAKTALLMGLLRGLGIEAVPVLVSSRLGDGLDQRLPMIGLFDHVIVRATIGGKTYFMDGTRTGDAKLDRLRVPPFRWGLPAVRGASLIAMLPPPLTEPADETVIRIDARGGVTLPAPIAVTTIWRGDAALGVRLAFDQLAGDARDKALRDYWRQQFDGIEIANQTATFDPASGEQRMTVEGKFPMRWRDGWYETDGTAVGWRADFARDAGPNADAPFAVEYPSYSKTVETILLPPSFPDQAKFGEPIAETVASIEYRRSGSLKDGVFTIERTARAIAPEFPAKDAPAAQVRLRALADQAVHLRMPKNYRHTEAELTALTKSTPTTAPAFLERGLALMRGGRYDEAIADFDKAQATDPKYVWAYANRGLTRVWQGNHVAAARDLDAALALDPQNVVALRGKGFLVEQQGNYPDAIALYTRALAIENESFALFRRANAHFRMTKYDLALADIDAALAKDPLSVDLRLLRANVLKKQGRDELVAAEAIKLLDMPSTDPGPYVTAGKILASVDRRSDAMKAFDRAIATKPEAYIYINRAESRAKDDVAGRHADYAAAIKLDPASEAALLGRAQMQIDSKDWAGMAQTYDRLIAIQPKIAYRLVDRGSAWLRAGNVTRAEADFATAKRMAGGDAELLNAICWQRGTSGKTLPAALSDCNAALALQPASEAYLDSRALVFLRLGRFAESIADYDKAIAKRPDQAESLYGRAIARARAGNQAGSTADAAAAKKSKADIAERFAEWGLTL